MKKIAIFVGGGMVQAIRSNIGPDLDIEIVYEDYESYCVSGKEILYPMDSWQEIQGELEFGNY